MMDNLVKKGGDGAIKYKVYMYECNSTSLATARTVTAEFDGCLSLILMEIDKSDNDRPTVTLNGTAIEYTRYRNPGYYRMFYEYTVAVRKGDVLSFSDSNSSEHTFIVIGTNGYPQNLTFLNNRSDKITYSGTHTNRYVLSLAFARGTYALKNLSCSVSGGKVDKIADGELVGSQKAYIYIIDTSDSKATVSLASGQDAYGCIGIWVF